MERYDLFMTWRETEKNVIFGKLKIVLVAILTLGV